MDFRRLAPDRLNGCNELLDRVSGLRADGLYPEAAEHATDLRGRLHELVSSDGLDVELLAESARLFAELGDLKEAQRLFDAVEQLATQDSGIWFNRALMAWKRGQWQEAEQVAERGYRIHPQDDELAHLLALVQGTSRVYRNGLSLQGMTLAAPEAGVEDRRRPLHVLTMSLPQRTCGYTYRTHYLLKAQKSLGLTPVAATAPAFPFFERMDVFADVEELDGVPYHRLAQFIPSLESRRIRRDKEQRRHGSDPRQPLDSYLQRYSQFLGKLAQGIRPGILHAHSNHFNALATEPVARALGIPWVYEVRGLWEETAISGGKIEYGSDKYELVRETETRCCLSADAVVTLSRTMKDELVERGVPGEKIFRAPNAVDPGHFPVLTRDAGLARELDLGDGPVIGYIGSVSAYEGLDLLVHAFARVHKEIPAARLLIVGDGPDATAVHEVVGELGLTDSVRLVGRVDHDAVLGMYSLIDVFVVARLPFRVCEIVTPLKPNEAMATGRALVVSDVAALKEMVIEDVTGVSFQAGSPEALAAVCLDLCRDDERRARLGQQAARWVREHRTWLSTTRTHLQAYEYAWAAHGSRRLPDMSARA